MKRSRRHDIVSARHDTVGRPRASVAFAAALKNLEIVAES
jgi:hypothetical protein